MELRIIEKNVTSWRRTDIFPCPECGKKLTYKQDYTHKNCGIKYKLLMIF